MARPPREDYPGAWHHVMHRATRRKTIFKTEGDFVLFLDTLSDTAARHALEVHAYAIMPNHYHLLVRSLDCELSRAMQQFNGMFTQRLNKVNGWDGPIFRGRFTNRLVRDERHLAYVLAYIHLNPLKASLVTRVDADRAWTSHRAYLGKDTRPPWLTTDTLLASLGGTDALQAFVLGLHRGKHDWPSAFDVEHGWPLAQEHAEPQDPQQTSTPVSRGAPGGPDEWLTALCSITGTTLTELKQSIHGPRGNPARRFAVYALARGTRLSHPEIGKLLGMSTTAVAKDLSRSRRGIAELGVWSEAWKEYVSIGRV